MIYVDSNCWVYWLDERFHEHRYVIEPIRKAIHEGIIMSYVTFIEVAHYLRNLKRKDFDRNIGRIKNLSTLRLVNLDSTVTDLALKELSQHAPKGIGGRDSVILATMNLLGVSKIITHDQAFRKIRRIRAIDPVPVGV